jgi:hypothetical protein
MRLSIATRARAFEQLDEALPDFLGLLLVRQDRRQRFGQRARGFRMQAARIQAGPHREQFQHLRHARAQARGIVIAR